MRNKDKGVRVSMRVDLPFTPTPEQEARLQQLFRDMLLKEHRRRKNEAARRLIELPNRSTADS